MVAEYMILVSHGHCVERSCLMQTVKQRTYAWKQTRLLGSVLSEKSGNFGLRKAINRYVPTCYCYSLVHGRSTIDRKNPTKLHDRSSISLNRLASEIIDDHDEDWDGGTRW